jgi:hypothetical protein
MRTTALAAVLASLVACDSGSAGGTTGPLAPVKSYPTSYNALALAGHENVVAFLDYNGNAKLAGHDTSEAILTVATRDPATPDDLLALGTLPLGANVGGAAGVDLAVTADWVTVTVSGALCVVSLASPTPTLIAVFPASAGVRALASGRWLLYADRDVLRVRDLGNAGGGYPQVGTDVPAAATVTGLALAPDGFYVFTTGGFGHLTVSGGAPSYAFTPSVDVRLFEKAYLRGTDLFAGGPSTFLGKARVARLDVSTPASPSLAATAEVDGVFEDFTFDAAGAYVVLLEGRDWATHEVAVFRPSGGSIGPASTAELSGVPRTYTSTAHANGGLLYAPYLATPYVSTASRIAAFPLP